MAQSSIQIEYNDDLSPLTELLARVNRPGDFFASGSLETPMPRLEIEGVGTISFPVPDFQAKEIVAHASRAPYGRGNETLIDPKVRNVWQIAPDKVRLGGKAWDATFQAVLARAVQGLGCPQKSVSGGFIAGGRRRGHSVPEKADQRSGW